MIDLHLHTNASDGHCSPQEVVARAVDAGLSVISVVDHDTFAAQPEVSRAASDAGLRAVPGIEITAVWQGVDVHILGYYLDPDSDRLAAFLKGQRTDRLRRVRTILERLRALGVDVPFEQVVVPVGDRVPNAVGRPQIARALVQAGYVADTREAFDRYLAEGQRAYVPRIGSAPAEVVGLIVSARGIASLAHPGLLGRDDLIPRLVSAGMQALEVYHPDHAPEDVDRYLALAARHHLVPTGGSDFHADEAHGAVLGRATLPRACLERLDALRSEAKPR